MENDFLILTDSQFSAVMHDLLEDGIDIDAFQDILPGKHQILCLILIVDPNPSPIFSSIF
jgi:hypothetical protein